ncbi:hypothetical protein M758_8G053600 [Ceratodon purpureus]|nr:hypothetical protein M758_8G053600 [Ceratodon purpureus]
MGAFRQRLAGHLLAVLLVTLLQICSAGRDPNLTSLGLPGIVGVWDRSNSTWNTLYPAARFRDDSVAGYFDIWPEHSAVNFEYYCEDPVLGNLSLSNFTYSAFEGRLDPRPYYDLGIVESYQPYWKHWLFWKVDTKRISYSINCEYNDLHDLYAYRFWKMIMRNGCAAAAVMQGFIQFIVAIAVTMMWGWRFLRFDRATKREHLKVWFWNLQWGDYFSEVVHLGLLVLAGYCMMEAIGHSDLHTWRPTVMYNTGVIYSYLSLFAVLSSIFRQIAYCWMEPAKIARFEILKKQNKLTIQGEIWYSLQGISDDWRWQRVFGQLGVLVLMGTYLSFVDDASGGGMDQMAGLVLAATVVACIWSFGVTAVVTFRSISHILAQTFPSFAKFAIRRVSPDDGGELGLDGVLMQSPPCVTCGHRPSGRIRSENFDEENQSHTA